MQSSSIFIGISGPISEVKKFCIDVQLEELKQMWGVGATPGWFSDFHSH